MKPYSPFVFIALVSNTSVRPQIPRKYQLNSLPLNVLCFEASLFCFNKHKNPLPGNSQAACMPILFQK